MIMAASAATATVDVDDNKKQQPIAKNKVFTRSPNKNNKQQTQNSRTPQEDHNYEASSRPSYAPFKYERYLSKEAVETGLEQGILTKGILRVNQRNFEQCFVDNPDGEEHGDLLILGAKDRNRAFHGDMVVVQLKPKERWFIHESYCKKLKLKVSSSSNFDAQTMDRRSNYEYRLANHNRLGEFADFSGVDDQYLKKTCEIVAILEKVGHRRVVGHIKPMPNNYNYFLFSPTDSRIPRLLIPSSRAPTGFYERPQDFENFIYLAEMDEWMEESKMPKGKLLDNLGQAGEVDAEHKALLRVNAVDERDYESFPEVWKSLPLPENTSQWTIDPKELAYRRDFRTEVVFTIDPLTARDLDDALHIKQTTLPDSGQPGWEVGVHIADVAHFLEKGTELDSWAAKRGTTVYLVHKVITMLPRVLCEEMCSLNPGVDRFTFSVVWLMDDDANIKDTWFGRSIIKSCAKLAYEHAQDIIDNPGKQFAISEMPPIHCGRRIRDIKTAVRHLDHIAKRLKAKRFHGGALKLDLPKLKFDVEKSSSGIWQPRGIRLDERRDANFLVEEFMLLANMEVAQRLYKHFNLRALLRRHPSPKKKELATLVERCAKLGITINALSSKTLADSVKMYERREEFQYTVLPALNQMLMKCMHLAQYFCTGSVLGPAEFRHYALSVDFYTHFTSPIRRYPDVIVHRLLAASLNYSDDPGYSVEDLKRISERANQTKACAKLCSETSGDIFFGALVRESGNFEAIGVVMSLFDECFDFLLLKYAIVKRVYLKKQTWLKSVYFGKLELEGPVSLVLLLKDEKDDKTQGVNMNKAANSTKDAKRTMATTTTVGTATNEKEIDIEEEDEQDVEISETEAPAWVRECRAEQRQTLNIMSVIRVQLVPMKNSVKYECNLIPTLDSNPLTWMDAKEHVEGLMPRRNDTTAEAASSAEDVLNK